MTMVQVAWTVIGLLAIAVFGMFGVFYYLGNKMDARFDGVSSRFDGVNARIHALAARLDSRIDSLAGQVQLSDVKVVSSAPLTVLAGLILAVAAVTAQVAVGAWDPDDAPYLSPPHES